MTEEATTKEVEFKLSQEQTEEVLQLNSDIVQLKFQLADISLQEADLDKEFKKLKAEKANILSSFLTKSQDAQKRLTELAKENGVPADTESWTFDFNSMSFKKS